MPTEHERETVFLRRCIRYEDSAAGRRLDERIAQLQRDDRTLRRGSRAMAFAFLLAMVGLGYGALFLDDFPAHLSLFASQFIIKLICTVGIGSIICLLGFTAIWFVYRKELNRRREECRRRVTQLLEFHVGNSRAFAGNAAHNNDETEARQGHLPFVPAAREKASRGR